MLFNNIRIVSRIFHDQLPNYKFTRLEKAFFSIPNNMKEFYIGNRNETDKTLFKHNNNDRCYYDVLNQNEMYYDDLEKLYEADSDNYCSNLENLYDLSKKYEKRKEVIL